MKVKVNLSNQTLEYMDTQPYIQGTDTRNKLSVYIEHSTIPQTEGAFNIMIAYALQNGRTTIKMANTGATTETIDDVFYDVFYFTAPSVLTSVAGNFVATIILKVNSNTYKVNVLNTVLNSVEFETFESALEETEATIIENLENMADDILQVQNELANKVTNGTNPTNISIQRINTRLNLQNNRVDLEWVDDLENPTKGNGIRIKNNEVYIFQGSSDIASFNLNLALFGYSLGNDTTHIKKYYDYGPAITETNLELKDNKGIEGIAPIIDLYNSYAELLLDSTKARLKYGDGYIEANDNGLTIQANATDESERAKLVMTGSSSDAFKIYTDGLLALTLDTDQHAIFESDIISKSDLYFDTSYDYSLGISGNGNFNISIPNNKKLTLNNVEIPNKTYVDNADNNLQSQIDGINAGQNLADIVADLTALNNLDTTKLQSGDKVEVLSDSDHDNVSTVYNWSGTIWQYIGAYGMDAYTKAQMDTALALKQNVISSSNKISSDYVDDTNSVDHKFVSQDEIDEFTAKQDALVETDSTAVSGGGVVVKDTYIENTFFATDSEVQNMLEEVFA